MRRAPLWVLLAVALAHPAQAQPSERRQLARELRALLDRRFEPPEPRTSTEVTLVLSVDRLRPLAVGDALTFRLSARNGSSRRITLPPARCPYWSTREPDDRGYVLELLSEDGELVPMALGWADESCAILTRDEALVPVTVEPGGEQALEAPPEVMRDVRRSARPGRYRMRVRYLDGPRIYASNEVSVVIAGGSERLWTCRRAMIDRIYDGTTVRHEQPAVVPGDPGDPSRGLLVLFSRNALGRSSESAATVELARVRADGTTDPSSQTLLRGEPPFSARIEAVWSRGGLIVAASLSHGRVSLASVELDASGAARVTRSTEIGATYPDYFGLAARGDRVALAYGDVLGGPLHLALFDGRGVARGAPIEVARRAAPTRTAVSLDEAGGWIAWSAPRRDALRMRRFTSSGELGPVLEIALVVPIALRGDASGADLALVDRISEHEGPTDLMGMIAARVGADGTIASRAPISAQDRMDAHEGSAAWAGDRLGAAFPIEWSGLMVAAGGRQHELSDALRGLPSVTPWGEGFAVAWADERDDTSPTCRDRRGCVTEVYVAAVDASGALRVTPSRVTRGARPEPRPIMNDGWERDCAP